MSAKIDSLLTNMDFVSFIKAYETHDYLEENHLSSFLFREKKT